MGRRARTLMINRVTMPEQTLECHRCHVYNPETIYLTEGLKFTCFPCFFAIHPDELTRLKTWIANPDYDIVQKRYVIHHTDEEYKIP